MAPAFSALRRRHFLRCSGIFCVAAAICALRRRQIFCVVLTFSALYWHFLCAVARVFCVALAAFFSLCFFALQRGFLRCIGIFSAPPPFYSTRRHCSDLGAVFFSKSILDGDRHCLEKTHTQSFFHRVRF